MAVVFVALPALVTCGIGINNVRRRSVRTEEAFAAIPKPGSVKAQLLKRSCDRAAVLPMTDYAGIGVEPLSGDRRDALYAVCEFDLAPHLDCTELLEGVVTATPLDVDVNTSDGWECAGHVATDGGVTIPPRTRGGGSGVGEMLRRTLLYR